MTRPALPASNICYSPPQWLGKLSVLILELRAPTLRKSAGVDFARGAQCGHHLANLCVHREPSNATRPAEGFGIATTEQGRKLYELHAWVAQQIASGCDLPRKNAHKFFQGVVFALDPQRGKKIHDELTAEIYDALFWNSETVDALPTRTDIAEFVESKLPERRKRFLAANETAKRAFEERVRGICKRIGLNPAKRRPAPR